MYQKDVTTIIIQIITKFDPFFAIKQNLTLNYGNKAQPYNNIKSNEP